jgi:pimeloyl-ACP methyl ester carboxylesterase
MVAMIDPSVQYFSGHDRAELAYREVGEGRPLILIHGFLASSEHWLRFGHAAKLTALGYRVVMPDVRAHGDSDRSHDASAYPPDILAEDGFALVEHLGLGAGDYDLGGYSLGGRTTIRMLALGATPGRAIVAGMGLEGIVHTAGRGGQFRHLLTNLGTFEFGSPDWTAEAYLQKIGADPVALLLALGTTVDTSPEALAAIETPTLIVVGAEDERHDSAEALAAALAHGRYAAVPGDHESAIRTPEFTVAITDFLGAATPGASIAG